MNFQPFAILLILSTLFTLNYLSPSYGQGTGSSGNTQPEDPVLEQAKRNKAIFEAQKAEAEARKAKAEAELAAFKASIGEVPKSGIGGDITFREKAGQIEAELLSEKAIQEISKIIADNISQHKKPGKILLFTSKNFPMFDDLIIFNSQVEILTKGFDKTIKESDETVKKISDLLDELKEKKFSIPKPKDDFQAKLIPPIPGMAGASLEALTGLLGFFRTNFTVGGISLTKDDKELLLALARDLGSDSTNVFLPEIFDAGILSDPSSGLIETLLDLGKKEAKAKAALQNHQKFFEKYDKILSTPGLPEMWKKMFVAEAENLKVVMAKLSSLVTSNTAFFTGLVANDDKNGPKFARIIRQKSIQSALDEGASVLLVKIHFAGGSFYTKKNLWTFFGKMPYYHMGGAIASYVLFDGKTGAVINSGLVPYHGEFVKARKVKDHVNRDYPPK